MVARADRLYALRAAAAQLAHDTIYRWIYEKYLVKGDPKVLRRKGKNHGAKEMRGKYSKGKLIRKRDKSAYNRQEAGHWETDTVVSGQGKSKACFATLAERKTRFYIAVKMPDRRTETIEKAIVGLPSGTGQDHYRRSRG